jgi:hypothetical protein
LCRAITAPSRQQRAAHGEAGAFFEMQVGDHQQALLFPVQRAGQVGMQGDAGERDGGGFGDGRFCVHGLL